MKAAIKSYTNAQLYKSLIFKENLKRSGIYCWTNSITGKSYIGSAKDLNNRFSTYYSPDALIKHLNRHSSSIYGAILKYGISKFSLDILEYCESNLLIEREQYYIDLLNPEYNILKIAGSRLGHKVSKETKVKIGIASRGRKHTIETIDKLRQRNKIVKPETILKLSLRSLGVSVKIFDILSNLSYQFSSITKAAEFLNIKRENMSKILDGNENYEGLTFQFELKDLRIQIFDSKFQLIEILDSRAKISKIYNIPSSTLSYYINTKKLYNNKFYFRKINY